MGEMRYTDALNAALREEMQRDPAVLLLGEDIAAWGDGGGVFSVTRGLVEQFGPERVRDTPISEESFVAIAVGAAMTGTRAVVELMYGDFLTLAMEPLVNQAAKAHYMFGGQATVPLVVRTNLGASGGKAAQHSQSLETWVAHVPGLEVAVPSTPADAKGLLKTAIRSDNPVVFFEHKLLYFTKGEVPDGEHLVPFGRAAVRRSGRDVTVVATQQMLVLAERVAGRLATEGIDVELIDPRTLVPLDVATIVESVEKTNRLVICHEAVERFGWAGEVAMQVIEHAFDSLDGPIVRVCGANTPVPYSEPLEAVVIPTEDDVEAGIRRVLAGIGTAERRVPTARAAAPVSRAPCTNGSRPVIMPRVSDSMDAAVISRWLRRDGAAVAAGEPLVEVETDKATLEVVAEAAGVLRIVAGDGEAVAPGETIATIDARGGAT